MGFLSWVEEWAGKIPIVGSHLSELLKRLQKAIEDWLDYPLRWLWFLRDWYSGVAKVVDEFVKDPAKFIGKRIPTWIKQGLAWLNASVSSLWTYIQQHITPVINNALSTIRNLYDYIYGVIRERLYEIINSFNRLKQFTLQAINNITLWVKNAPVWFLQQLQQARDFIWNIVEPRLKPILAFWSEKGPLLLQFASCPLCFIIKALGVNPSELARKFEEFRQWVTRKINTLTSVIMHIDEFIIKQLEKFILGLIAWFLYTLLNDLVSLQYDLETGEIVGEPKNPVTKLFVTMYEISRPELEYQSVKAEVKG